MNDILQILALMRNTASMSKSISPAFDIFYERIKEILEGSRIKVYRTANFEMLQAYWNVGKEIVEEEQKGKDRAGYGTYIIRNLSDKLTQEFGKGFNQSNLKYMRQFYMAFGKGHALRDELSWTHYRMLVKVEKEKARVFYIEEAIKGNEKLAETSLESALIEKLQQFLLELGNGFAFVGRQYRITADNDHFYLDMVFYNYILKCFLLIDLKTEKLTHQDIGQMDFYVRLFEDKIKQPDDNPTIGLILCTEKNKTIAKYSVLSEGKQIFASKYTLYLPDEESLKEEIRRERDHLETEQNLGQ